MSTEVAQRASKVLVMKQRQRSVRSDIVTDVERPWIDLVVDHGVVAARDLFLEAGIPASQAAGMALWLADQASRRRHVSESTANTYRHVLRELTPPGPARRLRAIPGQFKVLSRAA